MVYEPQEDSLLMETLIPGAYGNKKAIDIGCGSGILCKRMKEKGWHVIGVDIDPEAVKTTQKKAGVRVLQGDLFQPVKSEEFDLITFNSPYLPTGPEDEQLEDNQTWAGGKTGREVVNRFLEQAREHLSPGGQALLLISTLTGTEKVLEKARKSGLKAQVIAEKPLFYERLLVIKLERA